MGFHRGFVGVRAGKDNFSIRGTTVLRFHFAILQARSSKRNGPLVPVLAGGNPCT
jgi:hypothetical protein